MPFTRVASIAVLTATASAQLDTITGTFTESDDPRLDDNWPRYTTTKFDIIPEGATENNDSGFWVSSDYSTVEQLTGELKLEVNLTLNMKMMEGRNPF